MPSFFMAGTPGKMFTPMESKATYISEIISIEDDGSLIAVKCAMFCSGNENCQVFFISADNKCHHINNFHLQVGTPAATTTMLYIGEINVFTVFIYDEMKVSLTPIINFLWVL